MQHTSFLLRNLINSVGGILKYRICHVSAQTLQLGKPQCSKQTWAARLQEFRPITWCYWAQGSKASFYHLLFGKVSTSAPSEPCFSCRQRLPWGSSKYRQQKLCSPTARNTTVRQARFGFMLPAAAGAPEAKPFYVHIYIAVCLGEMFKPKCLGKVKTQYFKFFLFILKLLFS